MLKDLQKIFGSKPELDAKTVEFLTHALEKNNPPGFDYLEFKVSLSRLMNMGMEVETAYKSAFATASTIGLTKEVLVKTAQHYQEVLANEREQFELALKNRMELRVNGKQQEVESLKGQIETWRQEVAQLEKQIAQAQASVDNADSEAQQELEKIEATKSSFETTHQHILVVIGKDLENIQKFL